MCGICGAYRLTEEGEPVEQRELDRMSAALAPRGPDGKGQWRAPASRLALAHRRLAVLDPSDAAAQPMVSTDGRFAIVHNGEIYNFRALREELARAGARFATASDTEVILELWRREGARSLSRLRGMWAFALWDREAHELVLARDPYGIKPLYYSTSGGVLRFASQVKAIEASGAVPLAVDADGACGFLSWGAVPEPLTLRRAIRAVPAGHLLRADREGRTWLEPQPASIVVGGEEDPLAALRDSVSAHLVSDVPVALFLSAGLDSALVAALAAERAAELPVALTLSWAEARGSAADEVPVAANVAHSLGLRHVVREVAAADLRDGFEEMVAAMDQPSIDGFNTYLLSRLARDEGFKVVLSGLGGDELLGGYSSFRDVPRWSRWSGRLDRVPGLTRRWPRLARAVARGRPKLAGVLADGVSLAGAYALRRGLYLRDEVVALLPELSREWSTGPVFEAWRALEWDPLLDASTELADPWRAVHRLESTLYLRHQLLRDADWAGMAHGVEVRVPLVDLRLRAAFEAADFEPARSAGKAAVAARAAPELPAAVLRRPKSGFQLPVETWLGSAAPGRRRLRAGAQSRRLALRVLEAFGVELAHHAVAA